MLQAHLKNYWFIHEFGVQCQIIKDVQFRKIMFTFLNLVISKFWRKKILNGKPLSQERYDL